MAVQRVRVGDVLALERIPVDPVPDREYVAIGARSFGRGLFHYAPKPGDQLGSLRFFEVHPGRLVISNIKGWEGAIAVSTDRDRECVASNRFLSYRAIDDRVDVGWARWFFLSEPGLSLIQRASPGSADRNRTLAIERFEALEIPLPPIEEQRRTVERLERTHSWARSAAESFERSEEGEFAAALPALVDAVVRTKAFTFKPVGDLVDFVSDTVHPGDDPGEASAFVGLQHIEGHTGRCLGSDALGPMKGRKFRFRPGDVLYGYLRPYLNKVWLADRHGLCSVDQYVLRPRPGVSAALLAHTLRGRSVLDAAIEMTHSLQLPRLRSGLLSSVDVPTATPTDATELTARLDRVRDLVVAIAEKRRAQINTTRALVPATLNEVFGSDGHGTA